MIKQMYISTFLANRKQHIYIYIKSAFAINWFESTPSLSGIQSHNIYSIRHTSDTSTSHSTSSKRVAIVCCWCSWGPARLLVSFSTPSLSSSTSSSSSSSRYSHFLRHYIKLGTIAICNVVDFQIFMLAIGRALIVMNGTFISKVTNNNQLFLYFLFLIMVYC